jgi:carbon-monoxide dehydrogenase large subunit
MYRGVGKMQSCCVREALMDLGAAKLKLDPAEIRLRNLVSAEEMPYRHPTGGVFDSGDHPACLREALAAADYAGLRRRQAELRQNGYRFGVGLACFVETAGRSARSLQESGRRHGAYESAVVEMSEDGSCTVRTGLNPGGQGHETTLAQIAANELGIPFDAVRVLHGDTTAAPYSGWGTASSRGITFAGTATADACREIREKLVRLAADQLEVQAEDLEFSPPVIHLRGARHRSVPIRELARRAVIGIGLPDGVSPGLTARATFNPDRVPTSFGCCVAAVKIDRDTGQLSIEKLVFADDCGVMINPTIVEGQLVGGVAQGIGNALLEELIYSPDGQLMTASLLDYAIPKASDMPDVVVAHVETPSPWTSVGMKGVGESGITPVPAALLGAVSDALGRRVEALPLTRERVWRLLEQIDKPEQ